MSDVTLTIAGRGYTVACDPGQEGHIASLGRAIDAKLAELPGVAGQSESRTLLFATLLLADELHEARAGNGAATILAQPSRNSAGSDGAEALERLAERLEAVAGRLENGNPKA